MQWSKFEASDFLFPHNFHSVCDEFPKNPEAHRKEQHDKGLEIGRSAEYVTIAINDVWGAQLKSGGSLSSYEKLGYHANTADLLAGFLASGATIKIYRSTDKGIVETVINRG